MIRQFRHLGQCRRLKFPKPPRRSWRLALEPATRTEQALSGAFPEFPVYRAFTSRKIIRKLKERDGLAVDDVEEALKRVKAEGIKGLVVQPTHLIGGFEYTDLAKVLEGYGDQFEGLELAAPLLGDEDDGEAVIRAITDETAAYDDGETAICFMGHGTKASANAVYRQLQEKLREKGFGPRRFAAAL